MKRLDASGAARLDALASTVADAARRPWRHGFIMLMRRLAATHDDRPLPGLSKRPSQDAFRLGQQATLAFAAREIAQIEPRADRPFIRLFGLGLWGPGGALPLHYTETVREREHTRRDTAPGDFVDLFHHRALSHFYRAWAQSQAAAGLDRPHAETFSRYVAWLGGDEADDTANQPLPRHARWASAAHRVRSARNPEGLVQTLSHFFTVPLALREYVPQWIELEEGDQCCLGRAHPSSALGQAAVAGSRVADRQSHFRLMIGPLGMRQYLRFTPGDDGDALRSRDLRTLVEWVRAFVGFEFAWDVELRVLPQEVPVARLGGAERLGWSSWLAGRTAASAESIAGMVFSPEDYLARAAPSRRAATHETSA